MKKKKLNIEKSDSINWEYVQVIINNSRKAQKDGV